MKITETLALVNEMEHDEVIGGYVQKDTCHDIVGVESRAG